MNPGRNKVLHGVKLYTKPAELCNFLSSDTPLAHKLAAHAHYLCTCIHTTCTHTLLMLLHTYKHTLLAYSPLTQHAHTTITCMQVFYSLTCKTPVHLFAIIHFCSPVGRSLLMVALLGLAIFWIYSLIGFAFYRELMLKESTGRHCRTMYQCFVTLIHHGLVDSPYAVCFVKSVQNYYNYNFQNESKFGHFCMLNDLSF